MTRQWKKKPTDPKHTTVLRPRAIAPFFTVHSNTIRWIAPHVSIHSHSPLHVHTIFTPVHFQSGVPTPTFMHSRKRIRRLQHGPIANAVLEVQRCVFFLIVCLCGRALRVLWAIRDGYPNCFCYSLYSARIWLSSGPKGAVSSQCFLHFFVSHLHILATFGAKAPCSCSLPPQTHLNDATVYLEMWMLAPNVVQMFTMLFFV